MIEQILGWISNILFFLGAIWLSQKKTSGFYAQIFANLFYIIQASMMKNYSLLWLSIILIFVNCYAIYKWEKDRIC